jgi:predicted nucleic acid-binding protein
MIVAAITSGDLPAMTTPEVIQEFAHVRGRRSGRIIAASFAHDFATMLAPLRMTEAEHLETGIELWREHEELGAFDAVLAAVALDTKYATIVSADRAFAAVPGLNHVYPDAEGVRSLVEV